MPDCVAREAAELVPAHDLGAAWFGARPFIERAAAFAGGTHTIEDVYLAIMRHEAQLWLVVSGGRTIGAVVTEIVNYPRKRALNILYLAGEDMNLIMSLDAELFDWAHKNGCSCAIMPSGRRGWERVLARRGWEKPMLRMSKELR